MRRVTLSGNQFRLFNNRSWPISDRFSARKLWDGRFHSFKW